MNSNFGDTRYLKLENIRKMIERFLVERVMTVDELAVSLKVTARNVEQVLTDDISQELVAKINLPLIALYCSTKWY